MFLIPQFDYYQAEDSVKGKHILFLERACTASRHETLFSSTLPGFYTTVTKKQQRHS